MGYARRYGEDGYLSVIDRALLPSRNIAFNVADLAKFSIHDRSREREFEYASLQTTSHEFLVHGPIFGDGLICVKLKTLRAAGFSPHMLNPTHAPLVVYDYTYYRFDETDAAINFARAFLPDCAIEHVPMFFFLAATRRAIQRSLINEVANVDDLREWTFRFVGAIEAEVRASLPVAFLEEFCDPITNITEQPGAERPLVLLRAISYFMFFDGCRRVASERTIRKDWMRLDMMRLPEE